MSSTQLALDPWTVLCNHHLLSISRTFPSSQIKMLLINNYFPLLPSPRPWQRLFYFLCLQVGLFSIPHPHRIIHCLSSCVWLISLSIMSSEFLPVEACIRTSFVFKDEYYSTLCIYHIGFIHSSGDGRLDGFHPLATVNILLYILIAF